MEPVRGLAVVTTHHLVKSIQCPFSSTLMVITHRFAKSIQYLLSSTKPILRWFGATHCTATSTQCLSSSSKTYTTIVCRCGFWSVVPLSKRIELLQKGGNATQPAINLSFCTSCSLCHCLSVQNLSQYCSGALYEFQGYYCRKEGMRPSQVHNLVSVVMAKLGSWYAVTEAHA